MNRNKLVFRPVILLFIFAAIIGLTCCEDRKTASTDPEDIGSRVPGDELVLSYQLFNLELAAEEANHIQRNSSERGGRSSSVKPPCMVALEVLKDPCDFDCGLYDFECLQKYIDCKHTTATTNRSSSSDGDGAEPLPIASDTSMVADVDLTEMVIFSDEPEATQFKLVTSEGEVYATSDRSPDYFRYDKEKRHAIYGIQVKNPKLGREPLVMHMSTSIVNAAGEKRVIELKHPLGLVFTR